MHTVYLQYSNNTISVRSQYDRSTITSRSQFGNKQYEIGGGQPIYFHPQYLKIARSALAKIGINWQKLAKIVKIARLALAKIGINWQKLAKIENLL